MSEELNFKPHLTGVLGHPVSENPTVVMQEAAFNDKGLNWRYITMEVLPDDLKSAIDGLRALNFDGINLTIPHKVAVMEYLDEIDKSALLIGAVNTVHNKNNKLIGYNTDGQGFTLSLMKNDVDIKGKKFTVLGAGGAAKAIAVECALMGLKEIVIINRDSVKGKSLAKKIKENTKTVAKFIKWEGTAKIDKDTDVLVNATSIGLFPDKNKPDIDYDFITKDKIICDVIPNPPLTEFLKTAESRGAKTFDGLGMLVNQGLIGFEIWTGEDANEIIMTNALKSVFEK